MPPCKNCGEDLLWSREGDGRWIPIDPESITGDEVELEDKPGSVRHEAWHRRHKCPSRFKRKAPPESPPRVVAFGTFNFEELAAFSILHLLPSAPPEVARAAHRALAAIHHPDRGGDPVKMAEINAAYEVLRRR